MVWEIDLRPLEGQPDREAARVASDAERLGLARGFGVAAAQGYLVQGADLSAVDMGRLAHELFADTIVQRARVAELGDAQLLAPPPELSGDAPAVVHVILKPGVMDPAAQSARATARDLGLPVDTIRRLRKYWFTGLTQEQVGELGRRLLANDAIEEAILGPLPVDRLGFARGYEFALRHVAVRELDDQGLMQLSRSGQLYLQLAEMQTIQAHFRELGREPTDAELETLAQTWSEHCSHKTLAGRIAYRDERQTLQFENMLKETIFAATTQLRAQWGSQDWCVSVFKDNAGVVRFDDQYNLAFKVETHNHPSALEPYGGANTGVGGVIRDTIGTGLGAKPVCNTDVFCFAPPDTPSESLPPGVLHPRLVMRGVVEGVRDYGNRMGIPTVNGAVYFDRRYLGNPLVYCGNVGLLPHDKSFKQVQPNDLIVAVGGRTGRDGIHGATFSSAELTHESESLSGGAVQIGNAIEEKKVLDVLLAARDEELFTALTDCGAGGFSSAVGEMGEEVGAEVWLDRAPVKYDGLSYTEIWISEAQERMVLSVPENKWPRLQALCEAEDVEATVIGKFVPTGRLQLRYEDHLVADLSMQLLHQGRPPVVRQAVYDPPPAVRLPLPAEADPTGAVMDILGSLNVASKEWIIRQYDHEVQGGSVVKPLVGVDQQGPGDAAVVRPVLSSRRGVVVGCGMNPRYGDFDTYHMAASAIDEAVRNCVAVGADPSRIAILDNFCWGDCERNETLGSLVRAALACRDLSLVLETPFISGKDSLNNEFSYVDAQGVRQTIAIAPSLLISAMGQVADVARCVTMDLKRPGNRLYLVGNTHDELGGSHYCLIRGLAGGNVPQVDPPLAKQTFRSVHRAIDVGWVNSCHDLSEGGLAVAAAEMAFAGGLGAQLDLRCVPHTLPGELQPRQRDTGLLFAESNSRFLCEVPETHAAQFEALLAEVPHAAIGAVTSSDELNVVGTDGRNCLVAPLADLKHAWQAPLKNP
jgi:phosphoribosylformylglycinamidine synthase